MAGGRTAQMLLLACLAHAGPVLAGPWIDPGDAGLRHDLTLLADSGIINVPLTTWPLAWGDIAAALQSVRSSADPQIQPALQRVRRAFKQAARANRVKAHVRWAVAADVAATLRTFSAMPREEGELELGLDWLGANTAYRLQVTAAADPADGETTRFDGSYAGIALGNWMLAAGAFDRWWGPGWDGSLILSSNPRPVPALSLQRNTSLPFEWTGLRWLGPWQLTALLGQLDDDNGTTVADALLFGLRINFKPTRTVEIGLSRSSQWGGAGRPEQLDTFFDMLTGRDNTGGSGITAANEPGNQLAGADIRWTSPLGRAPYAVYAQIVGEDEAGGLPSQDMGLAGIEWWGTLGREHSYRAHVEYADTAVDVVSTPRFNVAYRHHIYQSGYRYHDRIIGHGIGPDGRITTLGLLAQHRSGSRWEAAVRHIEYDRDNPASATQWNAQLGYRWRAGDNHWQASGVLERQESNTRLHMGLQWQREF